MSEEEQKVDLEALELSIHRLGTFAHIFFYPGLFCTIGFFLLGLTANLVSTFAFPLDSIPSQVFSIFANLFYSLLGSVGLPGLVAGIVFRNLLEKRKEAHPNYKNAASDFSVY